MNVSPAPAFSLVPEPSDVFVDKPVPSPEDRDRRREEARKILITLLARHILTQVQGMEEVGKAA